MVIYLHPDVSFSASNWRAIGLLFLIATLYFAAFFMLGLFVSCVTQIPKTTLTALMTLWVLLVLVIPNFSPFLAAKLRPVQSLYDVQKQSMALKNALGQLAREKTDTFIQAHGGDWEALGEDKKEEARQIWKEVYRRELMNLTTKEIAKLKLEFINGMESQVRVSHYISFVSPSAALTYLASDIARTGLESGRHFRRAVFRFRNQYLKRIDQYIEKTQDYSRLRNLRKEDDTPPFEYRELSLSQAISAHLPRIMVLVLYLVLFFFGAQIAFIRTQL